MADKNDSGFSSDGDFNLSPISKKPRMADDESENKTQSSGESVTECKTMQQSSSSESKGVESGDLFAKAAPDSNSSKRTFTVIFKENIRRSCQTRGKETVREMLLRYIHKHFGEKTFNNMVFKRQSDGCAINLGLPTGVLDDAGITYLCSFSNKEKISDYSKIRKYHVEKYRSWNMGFFDIKIEKGRRTQPDIGDIKNEVEKVRVDFFSEETLYEALCRDKRLKVTKKWYFKNDSQTEISLDHDADSYKGDCFTLFLKRIPEKSLPDDVPPLPEPNYSDATKVPIKASDTHINLERMSNIDNQSSSHQKSFNANAPAKSIVKLCDDNDLRKYIQDKYTIDIEKKHNDRQERKRLSNIRKFFENNYDHFALQHNHLTLASEVKQLMTLLDSVGAIVVELESGRKSFVGTCFVTGSHFVITNRHVYEDAIHKTGFRDFYVDFDFGNPDSYKYRFERKPVTSSSFPYELDYAILRLLNFSDEPLPPSLSKCGYVIPSYGRSLDVGKFLTLIGHPGGSEKAFDITCPIARPEDLGEDILLGLAKREPENLPNLKDERRQTYDVGTFFYGSSGSPGVLLRERLLIVLHCRGFHLNDGCDSYIEQGVLMSSILKDVDYKIRTGVLQRMTLKDIFDIECKLEPMEVE